MALAFKVNQSLIIGGGELAQEAICDETSGRLGLGASLPAKALANIRCLACRDRIIPSTPIVAVCAVHYNPV